MASSCIIRNMFLTLPLLIILSMTPLSSSFSPTDKVTKELLNQLCSKPTIDANFCVASLTSDPTTFTLDITGLLDSAIEKTEMLGLKNLAIMKNINRTTTDPKLKLTYSSCLKDYEVAIKAIKESQGFARSKMYESAASSVFKAFNSISSCDARLKLEKNVPSYVSLRNQFFLKMCTIDRAFAAVLRS